MVIGKTAQVPVVGWEKLVPVVAEIKDEEPKDEVDEPEELDIEPLEKTPLDPLIELALVTVPPAKEDEIEEEFPRVEDTGKELENEETAIDDGGIDDKRDVEEPLGRVIDVVLTVPNNVLGEISEVELLKLL